MSSLPNRLDVPHLTDISISEDTLSVDLLDGRSVSIPLEWYPRLLHASSNERENYRFTGNGEGIHWPDLDEDISGEAIVFGIRSQETTKSLRSWLDRRNA